MPEEPREGDGLGGHSALVGVALDEDRGLPGRLRKFGLVASGEGTPVEGAPGLKAHSLHSGIFEQALPTIGIAR